MAQRSSYLPELHEEWRAVPGASGYEVSSTGRVRSWRGAGRSTEPRSTPVVLRQQVNAKGYLWVVITGDDGRRRKRLVHHLVLESFVGPRQPGQECRHLDGNPASNAVANLAWGSQAENRADKIVHQTWGWRLSEADVIDMRERYAAGESIPSLRKQYGSEVHKIVTGQAWRHVGGPLSEVDHSGGRRGPKIGDAALTLRDVWVIRLSVAIFGSREAVPELAQRFNVTRSTINRIASGRSYPDMPGPRTVRGHSEPWTQVAA